MKFFPGTKTYIIGAILIAKGVAGFLLPDSAISADPASDIQLGLVALGLRAAIR